MIDLLILLLVPAIHFLENPRKYWYFFWAPLPAWLIDLAIANTTWRLIAGPLQGKEKTISDSLERLCGDTANLDQQLFIQIALKINRATRYPHIKAVT